jgi:hypothetical protein
MSTQATLAGRIRQSPDAPVRRSPLLPLRLVVNVGAGFLEGAL